MKLIVIVLLAFAIYQLITGAINFPSRQTYKNIENISKKKGVKEEFTELFISPIAKLISRFIRIDMYKRKKLVRNLARAGYTISPEEYYAEAIVISIYVLIASVVMIIMGITLFGFLGLILAVMLYFSNVDKVNDKLKVTNEAILRELPRFVRTHNHSKHANTQLLTIIEKYRMVAGKDFCYDLDVLITDLKTTGEEEALMRFDERVILRLILRLIPQCSMNTDRCIYLL